MNPESISSALDQLAGCVQKSQMARNHTHWGQHVTKFPGALSRGPTAEELAHHVRLFLEVDRELQSHPDQLSPAQARLWRVIAAFFELHRAPALRDAMVKALRIMEAAFPHPVPPSRSGLVQRSRRWSCWRKVHNETTRKNAWTAVIGSDSRFREPFCELVTRRNELARQLGHANFFDYRLRCDGWSPARWSDLLDHIERETAGPYQRARDFVDAHLTRLWKRSFSPDACWQYGDPWVQTAPESLPGHPSRWIHGAPDVLARLTLSGLGWAGRLYQLHVQRRHTWFPTAFCIHMNRGADVRIGANIGRDMQSLQLMLHEAGHAAWFTQLDPALPFLLRTPAHPLLSEGFSMLMQQLPFLPSWVRASRPGGRLRGILRHERDIRRADWIDRVFFVRWSLALIHFERQLYVGDDPDHQALYWRMVHRYQSFTMPAGREGCVDYLSKHHLVTHPASYHHYLFGMCFASQLTRRLARLQGHDTDPLDLDLTGRSSMLGLPTADSLAAGEYLRSNLFAPGADLDDPFVLAEQVCEAPFSAAALLEDLSRLESMA